MLSSMNTPPWLRGVVVDLDCHTNHGRSDGSRPWIFSCTIDEDESWQLCVWHQGPEDQVELYRRGHGAQKVVTREQLDEELDAIRQHHECEHCKLKTYSMDPDSVVLTAEQQAACDATLAKHLAQREEERLVFTETTQEIYNYLFAHWTALQCLVRPMVNS